MNYLKRVLFNCAHCGKEFDRKEVGRVHGKESNVYLLCYCSAKCYTEAITQKPQPTTQGKELFTGGEWSIYEPETDEEKQLAEYWWIINPDGYEIAQMSNSHTGDKEKDERLANLSLLASSKDMYYALKECREWYERNMHRLDGDTPICFSNALSAIYKATPRPAAVSTVELAERHYEDVPLNKIIMSLLKVSDFTSLGHSIVYGTRHGNVKGVILMLQDQAVDHSASLERLLGKELLTDILNYKI